MWQKGLDIQDAALILTPASLDLHPLLELRVWKSVSAFSVCLPKPGRALRHEASTALLTLLTQLVVANSGCRGILRSLPLGSAEIGEVVLDAWHEVGLIKAPVADDAVALTDEGERAERWLGDQRPGEGDDPEASACHAIAIVMNCPDLRRPCGGWRLRNGNMLGKGGAVDGFVSEHVRGVAIERSCDRKQFQSSFPLQRHRSGTCAGVFCVLLLVSAGWQADLRNMLVRRR